MLAPTTWWGTSQEYSVACSRMRSEECKELASSLPHVMQLSLRKNKINGRVTGYDIWKPVKSSTWNTPVLSGVEHSDGRIVLTQRQSQDSQEETGVITLTPQGNEKVSRWWYKEYLIHYEGGGSQQLSSKITFNTLLKVCDECPCISFEEIADVNRGLESLRNATCQDGEKSLFDGMSIVAMGREETLSNDTGCLFTSQRLDKEYIVSRISKLGSISEEDCEANANKLMRHVKKINEVIGRECLPVNIKENGKDGKELGNHVLKVIPNNSSIASALADAGYGVTLKINETWGIRLVFYADFQSVNGPFELADQMMDVMKVGTGIGPIAP